MTKDEHSSRFLEAFFKRYNEEEKYKVIINVMKFFKLFAWVKKLLIFCEIKQNYLD